MNTRVISEKDPTCACMAAQLIKEGQKHPQNVEQREEG